jgi:DNA-binding SARP family transcriptional activator/tetratricopeptide (TPR) repeat protein
MLSIQLLGDQDLTSDGRSIWPRLGRRSVELIAYLVVHPDSPQPRHHVASRFWPDSSDAQALTNLRRELHQVRSILGPTNDVVTADARAIAWSPRDDDECDVTSFRCYVEQARVAQLDGDVNGLRQAAEAAVAAYRGPFMPGTYEDWVLEVREQLHRGCLRLLDELISVHENDDIGAALEFAGRRLELEPLEEVGYQGLMRLQSRAGDRAAALRTYHRCVSILDRELGVAPDPVTTSLYQDMCSATPGRDAAIATLAVRASRPHFVGRELELDELTQRWSKTGRRAQGLHLVTGEAGVGKSRLIDEFASGVERSGAVVAWARCIPRDGQNALAPVAQWLSSPSLRRRSDRLDPRWRVEVDRLLPSTSGGATPPGHSAMVDAWQRPQFRRGLAKALIDPHQPTLLVLDDMHWCDVETLTWLPSFLEQAERAPMLILAAARSEEVDDHRELVSMVSQLRRDGLTSETALAPLPTQHTASLAHNILGFPLSDSEVDQWQQVTGGFPLFVVELARAREQSATDVLAAGQLPRVHAALENRLMQLSPAGQMVAELASCVGRDFSLDLLCQASDLPSDTVLDAVDELWRRRIFRGRSPHTYDYSHDLLRDAAYQRIDAERRRLLHRRIAQALEVIHSDDPTTFAAALADQYGRADQPQRAVRYHISAAAAASAVFANVEAIRHYDRGIGLLQTLPAGRDRDRVELTLRHALSAPLNAEFGYASEALRRDLERSAALAERLADDRLLVLSLAGMFAVRFVQGDVDESFRIAERALELSRRCPDVAGQAHFAYGGAATSLGMHEVSLSHFTAAHELCIDQPPSVVGTRPEVHGRAWSAHALWLLGREEEAVRWCDWAIDRAEEAGHPYSLAVALAYAGITHQLRQDVELTAELAAKTQRICSRYHFAYYGEWGTILEGWSIGGHAGVDRINQGLHSLRAQGALARQPYFLGLLADALLTMGATERASATLDAAFSTAADHSDRWWLAELWRLKSLTCDGDKAAELVERALDVADSQGALALRHRIVAGSRSKAGSAND